MSTFELSDIAQSYLGSFQQSCKALLVVSTFWFLQAAPASAQAPFPEPGPAILQRADDLLRHAPMAPYERAASRLRGKPFRTPLVWRMHTSDEVRKFLQASMAEEYPEKQSRLDEAVLKVLGLAPADFSLRPFMEDLLTEQIAGAYDPKTKHFFLVREVGGLGTKLLQAVQDFGTVTVHELDHALQDQWFDLLALQKRMKTWSTDRQMATQSLFEGEATLVMLDYQIGETDMDASQMADLMTVLPGLPGMGNFAQAPLYFKRSLVFPYYLGMNFVRTLRQVGGWPLVDGVYADLPETTEQILHPAKYLHREPARPIHLSRLPERSGDWTTLGDDSGGEFLVRVVVEQHRLGDRDSIGFGWGGDRYRVYANGERRCLVWVTEWDTPADAAEFRQALEKKADWTLAARGTRVVVLIGAPAELSAPALVTP